MTSSSWKEVSQSLQVLRDHLHGPLLALCLVLAVSYEGVARALYLLAAALLCVSLIRFRRVEESLAQLKAELARLQGQLNDKTTALSAHLADLGQRLSELARDLGATQRELEEAKKYQLAQENTENAHRGLRIFAVMVAVVVASNAVVIIAGRHHLASYGERLGDVISRLVSIEQRFETLPTPQISMLDARITNELKRVEHLCRFNCPAPVITATPVAASAIEPAAVPVEEPRAVVHPTDALPAPVAVVKPVQSTKAAKSRVDSPAPAAVSTLAVATAPGVIATTPNQPLQTSFRSYLPLSD